MWLCLYLERAYARGWKQCVGVDINERYQSKYEDICGVQYIMSTFESLDHDIIGSGYQSISLWGVLEHIYDPSEVLKT